MPPSLYLTPNKNHKAQNLYVCWNYNNFLIIWSPWWFCIGLSTVNVLDSHRLVSPLWSPAQLAGPFHFSCVSSTSPPSDPKAGAPSFSVALPHAHRAPPTMLRPLVFQKLMCKDVGCISFWEGTAALSIPPPSHAGFFSCRRFSWRAQEATRMAQPIKGTEGHSEPARRHGPAHRSAHSIASFLMDESASHVSFIHTPTTGCWRSFYWLKSPLGTSLPNMIQWCHVNSLKWAMVGVITPQQSANAATQGSCSAQSWWPVKCTTVYPCLEARFPIVTNQYHNIFLKNQLGGVSLSPNAPQKPPSSWRFSNSMGPSS